MLPFNGIFVSRNRGAACFFELTDRQWIELLWKILFVTFIFSGNRELGVFGHFEINFPAFRREDMNAKYPLGLSLHALYGLAIRRQDRISELQRKP